MLAEGLLGPDALRWKVCLGGDLMDMITSVLAMHERILLLRATQGRTQQAVAG